MMTPQEVANCTFAKSMMGGYNMSSVDDFLDKLTEDYSALYKENAALKSKLKTVTDKLAEYREMEGAMSSTLLTAQKMASTMLSEAEQKKNSILVEANAAAQAKRAQADQAVAAQEQRIIEARARVDKELEAERKRLAVGQEKLRAFIRDVTQVCSEQLKLLEKLPEIPMEELEAPVAAPSIPNVVQAVPAPAAESEEAETATATVAAFAAAAAAKKADNMGPPEGDPFDSDAPVSGGEDMAPTRVLDDLHFGRNYKKE